MIKAIISDLSGVLLKPVDENYKGGLNALNKKLSEDGKYDFWQYFRLNDELLEFYNSLKENLQIYVFTTGTIQNNSAIKPKLEGIFNQVFSCSELGLNNKDKDAFLSILKEIGLEPEEILYIDDKEENVELARSVGLTALKYNSNEKVKEDILRLQ